MTAIYKNSLGTYPIKLRMHRYQNKNLAIQMICAAGAYKGESFAFLTTNLYKLDKPNQAFIDINNLENAIEFIKKYRLGKIVNRASSGYCTYPVVEFNMEEVEKYV